MEPTRTTTRTTTHPAAPLQVRVTHGRGWYVGRVGEVFRVIPEPYRRSGAPEDASRRDYFTLVDSEGQDTGRAIHPADVELV